MTVPISSLRPGIPHSNSSGGLLLGCIADDFTGATDLANTLVRQGMRTVQYIGVPARPEDLPGTDAVVVALKSRTIPAGEAVRQSVAALDVLRAAGARQYYFKYCSTFDSTDEGNIGPVIEALLAALEADFTVACPAFPANGRTVYRGYLFVGDGLLSESGMRHHPLTPMTDPNLVRVLGRQMRGPVGLVPYEVVRRGGAAVRRRFDGLRAGGVRCAIVDALDDAHLIEAGAACAGLPLVTGGSGMAMGLPANFRRAGLLPEDTEAVAPLPAAEGPAAVIAGSCSTATRAQVEVMASRHPAFRIDALRLGEADVAGEALAWARPRLAAGPVLLYSSAAPEAVAQVQARMGRDEAGASVERALADVARGLVAAGVRRLVVAGGETSGAVVSALGVRSLRIGPEIAPGVPWTIADAAGTSLCLALKSGNFGGPDFFAQALDMTS